MRKVILDTDIISYLFKQHKKVTDNFNNYISENKFVYISRITVVEILGGLKARNAEKQIEKFKEFLCNHKVLDTSELSAEKSAGIFAELYKKGKHSGNFDILIAGIALANDLKLITNNISDYENISELEIENWAL